MFMPITHKLKTELKSYNVDECFEVMYTFWLKTIFQLEH